MGINYEKMEMGNPRCIAPLIGAALISAGGALLSGILGSSATSSANEQNAANAKAANAITNQQWGAEMKLKKTEIDQTEISGLKDWINQVPARRKNFLDMWSGGK